jgi:HlyD family secretion protein
LKKVVTWLVALGVVGGSAAYVVLRARSSEPPVVFRRVKVDRGAVEQVVTANGTLSAVVTVQVGSQVSGTILKLFADFNSRVKEGQIVAQIDPTRFKATVEQAQAALKNAEASAARARVNQKQARLDYDRAKELFARQVVGQAELDTLKSKLDVSDVDLAASDAAVAQARAQVGMAKVDLERTTIRSPISGVVLQRAVDVGQTVAASLQAPTLFTIAQDLSHMEVRAAIDEADVGKLKEGLDAKFTVDAYPGQEFAATIFQIRSQPNVTSNVVTYDAILRVDNPDGRLRPGMTANVRVVTDRRDDVVRVPNAALRFKPSPDMLTSGGGPGAGGRDGRSWGGGNGRTLTDARGGDEGRRGAGGPGGLAGGPGRPGGGWRGGPPGEGGGRQLARVYKPLGEKVAAVVFMPGIADDEYTEVKGGRLNVGDEIVVEMTGGGPAARGGPGGPGSNAMRGRGPRFF